MNLNPGGTSRIRILATLTMVGLLAVGCGPLGDDEDPTATSETIAQPTTAPDGATAPAGTGEPVDGTPQSVVDELSELIVQGIATPAGTPSVAFPVEPGTPPGGSDVIVSTPAVPGVTDYPSDATPLPTGNGADSDAQRAPLAGSDGTSGATPPGIVPEAATEPASAPESTLDGTPGLAVLEDSTPPAQDIDLQAIDPVQVNSCEPSDVPLLVDGELSYITTTDVNFRTGPGSDCDTIGDGPLGSNIPVAVLSAPVIREGEEEYTWVQIRVNDITGWVIVEAIEPVG